MIFEVGAPLGAEDLQVPLPLARPLLQLGHPHPCVGRNLRPSLARFPLLHSTTSGAIHAVGAREVAPTRT